jgi:hypothetical protein
VSIDLIAESERIGVTVHWLREADDYDAESKHDNLCADACDAGITPNEMLGRVQTRSDKPQWSLTPPPWEIFRLRRQARKQARRAHR